MAQRHEQPERLADQYDVLNLGCGTDQPARELNVDISAAVDPDLVLDLEATPWPFPDDAFERVRRSRPCTDPSSLMESHAARFIRKYS